LVVYLETNCQRRTSISLDNTFVGSQPMSTAIHIEPK
jgi:hypothetical protein